MRDAEHGGTGPAQIQAQSLVVGGTPARGTGPGASCPHAAEHRPKPATPAARARHVGGRFLHARVRPCVGAAARAGRGVRDVGPPSGGHPPAIGLPSTGRAHGPGAEESSSAPATLRTPGLSAPEAARRFAWAPVAGATGYHVKFFRSDSLVFAADTTGPAITIPHSGDLQSASTVSARRSTGGTSGRSSRADARRRRSCRPSSSSAIADVGRLSDRDTARSPCD